MTVDVVTETVIARPSAQVASAIRSPNRKDLARLEEPVERS